MRAARCHPARRARRKEGRAGSASRAQLARQQEVTGRYTSGVARRRKRTRALGGRGCLRAAARSQSVAGLGGARRRSRRGERGGPVLHSLPVRCVCLCLCLCVSGCACVYACVPATETGTTETANEGQDETEGARRRRDNRELLPARARPPGWLGGGGGGEAPGWDRVGIKRWAGWMGGGLLGGFAGRAGVWVCGGMVGIGGAGLQQRAERAERA